MMASPARIATLVAVPVAVLAGALVFWLLNGFTGGRGTGKPHTPRPQATGTVQVAAPPLDERSATVCRALLAKLPEAVRDRPRRPVTAGPEQNAAYGDPPIVLSCGVDQPAVPQVAQLLVLSGVCWLPEERADDQVWTAVDRAVPVRVTVPKAYDPAGQWVIDFSPAIVDAVPPARTTCLSTASPR
jgi:Protein of unknown function (DUF3515)